MAGFSNFAFRQMVREFGGAGLLATEMISARSFAWGNGGRAEGPDRLWGVKDEPRPLAVQIWDNDPHRLAEVGARLAHEYRVSVVDVNFGCPVARVAAAARSGSYLLGRPDLVGEIVARLVAACRPVPVTAKIRLGCARGGGDSVAVAQAIESAGAAALTVHGRYAEDFLRGRADWEAIAALKPHLRRIPLIGNGDLDSAAHVVAAFQRYEVDGVMIGRAALGRPWLFRQIEAALRQAPVPPEPSRAEQQQHLLRHFQLLVNRFGEEKATLLVRKYACCCARGRAGARQFRALAAQARSAAEFRAVVEKYYP